MTARRRWSQCAAIGLTVLLAFSALSALATAASPAGGAASGTASMSADSSPIASAATGPAVSSPIAPPPAPLTAQASVSPDSSRGAAIVAALSEKGVSARDVFLPDFSAANPNQRSDSHVNLTYTTAPAPYGIGDFGLRNVSGTVTPYITRTSSLNASFNSSSEFYGYTPDLSSPDEYGVQLNAVLNNVTLFGETGYQFWTQNVFEFVPSNDSLQFVSNIWNFSSPAADLTCNVFYAAGGYNECPEYYYGLSEPIPAVYPFTARLWLNTTLNQGRDEVFFNYTVSSADGDYAGGYDYAIFNSTAPGGNPALTPPAAFEANGFQDNPLGLPDDFEVTVGGPGGGSNFDLFDATGATVSLTYLNGTTGLYTNVDSAYNVGGDTGETSTGLNAAWAQYTGCSNCVQLTDGPSFQYGLWNVSGGTPEGAYASAPYLLFNVDPMTAFVFIAPGDGITNLSLFQWAPDNLYDSSNGWVLPEGYYTIWILAAEYDPISGTVDLTSTCLPCTYDVGLNYDPTTGVYTPLWALNETAASYISSGYDAFGNYQLYNNQYLPLGQVPCFSSFGCGYFPWFGAFNDWMFPVFPGVFLFDVGDVDVAAPPTFNTNFPPGPSFQAAVNYFGVPDSNDLQIVFYDDSDSGITGGTIGGWWPAASYFGPSQSVASVQFWNTTYSGILGTTFETGGMALFLYGGYDNEIEDDSFYTSIPVSANPYSTTAAYFGSVGLVDTDFGDAFLYGAAAWTDCDACDVVANNIFDTVITATQLYFDPYTGLFPNQFPYAFSQAYNGPYSPGTNIIGGDYLGGNYWWDYGLYWNPYNVVPYAALNPLPYLEFGAPSAYICETVFYYCDYGGGDFYPLTYSTLYSVTFEEVGLPAGTPWGVGTPVDGSDSPLGDLETGTVLNSSLAPGTVNLTDPAGTYDYLPFSGNPSYAAADGTFEVVNQSVLVVVDFETAYSLTVTETGLPAGTDWTVTATGSATSNFTTANTSSIVLGALLPGTYTWSAATTASFAPVPINASVSISGNTTVTVRFVAEYTLTVTETGLPSGTTWYFTYQSTAGYSGLATSSGASNTVTDLPAVSYDWSVAASGYVGTPSFGVVSVSGDTTLTISFAASNATGTLSGAVTPSSGTLWVDGSQETLGSGGVFSVTVPVGVHSIEVTASGYAPYFNNVSVTAGQTTHLSIALTSSSSPANTSGVGTLGWLLVAVLAVVVAVLLVTTLLFARRGRQPPPVTPYVPAAASAPPPAPPAWQEPPPPSG